MSEPRTGLGEAADAAPTFRRARRERAAARGHGDRLRLRESAEKAYLAACQAADCVAVRLGRRAPKGTSARVDALRRFDEQEGTITELRFHRVHRELHSQCFHEDVCDPKRIDDAIAEAEKLVSAVAERLSCRRARRPARPRR
jgi:hypothetical protein